MLFDLGLATDDLPSTGLGAPLHGRRRRGPATKHRVPKWIPGDVEPPVATRLPRALRPARDADLPAYMAHLLRLSAGSLRARFGIVPARTSLEAHAQPAADRKLMLLWEDRMARGAIELHLLDAKSAEFALSLDDALHGLGLGSSMMAGALEWAERLGLARLFVLCDPANGPMRRLVRRCGARVTLDEEELSAWIDVGRALERCRHAANGMAG